MDRDDSLLDALSGLLLNDNNRSTTESSTQTNAPHMESIEDEEPPPPYEPSASYTENRPQICPPLPTNEATNYGLGPSILPR